MDTNVNKQSETYYWKIDYLVFYNGQSDNGTTGSISSNKRDWKANTVENKIKNHYRKPEAGIVQVSVRFVKDTPVSKEIYDKISSDFTIP